MNKEFWNDRYSEEAFVYGKQPNAFFENTLMKYEPGALLLPCEGEGRNSVFAARHKWKVDAFVQIESGRLKF